MLFNHVANRVNPVHFDVVVDMFVQRLGFVELRRTGRATWLRQSGANIDLQLSRSDSGHRDPDRERSQVSFLSETPDADLKRLAAWFDAKGLPANVGSYSEREFYLDVPAAFVDFVIEAMRPELAVYDVAEPRDDEGGSPAAFDGPDQAASMMTSDAVGHLPRP